MPVIKPFSQLTTSELFAIAKLRIEVFVTEQKITDPELDDTDKLAYHVLKTKENDNAVAVARFFIEDGKLMIGRVAVDHNYRHQHLGSKIMEAIFDYVKENELADMVYVHAQVQAQDFYDRLGFTPIGDQFDEAGVMHQMMKKDL